MQLEWMTMTPTDSEGETYRCHYLFNPLTAQCYATVVEPRKGNCLYQTDIRVRGYDRSYVTLEAAQRYCEFVAETYEREECEALEESLKKKAAPLEEKVGNNIVDA
jgi:hypothetical protein